ncbi:Rieske 2Fe-2S domain-containing protein [Acuticoccus mangrovi]|uniref:Rieske 2Fe-2S domain-containing protein n=1 Tax=Acuticoccus mangrovi TaxID=2796142 RepID=A0A934IL62_9HYPH|nr:Rieske 2Fe-2S domain-containing protein [Acuticoccus mangrovi]MBJ3775832.1 Rieske 2Fe-2S domain-containing protein [Acuticoccus mangrovi]
MNAIADIDWPSSDFTRVPYRVFVDPEIYKLEQERIFRGPIWAYLGLEAEVPNPGDYKTTFVGDTPMVLQRTMDGELAAFENRCAHRGAIVRREPFGNDTEHRCVYHQWCYDLKGALTGVPFRRGVQGKGGYPKDFDLSKHPMRPMRVATYNGVIFGTFSDATPPLKTFLGTSICAYLDRLFHKPVKVLGYLRQDIKSNWKLYTENVKDPYHAGLLHLFHATFGLYRSTQKGAVLMSESKFNSVLYNIGGNYDKDLAEENYKNQKKYVPTDYDLYDPQLLASRPDFPDGIANMIMCIAPTVVVQQIMNTMATRNIRPKGPGQFELFWTYFGFADDDEELTQIRLTQANLIGPSGYISMEDSEATEMVQDNAVVRSTGDTVIEMGGRGEIHDLDYLISEMPIRGFWSHYAKLMAEPPALQEAAE